MMARQLHLFKSKRQRGELPPPPSEFALQCTVVDSLRRWAAPGWRFFHIPLGEYRPIETARRLKRMGTTPGLFDILLISPKGGHFWLELKARNGRLSDAQQNFATMCRERGIPHAVARSFDEAVAQLKEWGALKPGVHWQ